MSSPLGKNILSLLIFFIFIGGLLFYNKTYILKPSCEQPITYSIGQFDSRFGISKDELKEMLAESGAVWSNSINKKLFTYSPTSKLKINLIYDYRQQATEQLKSLGISIDDSKMGYDQLKAKYESLIFSYNQNKAELQSQIASFERRKNAYEAEVQQQNNQGGASAEEYQKLSEEKAALENEVAKIQQKQNELNASVDTINSVKDVLNQMVERLNLNVQKFNTVGSSVGKTFKEGEFIRDSSGNEYINIYQFDNKSKLMKVLTHELGHALGLEHVKNPQAIMYYLNEGSNTEVSGDDLAELKKVCGVK